MLIHKPAHSFPNVVISMIIQLRLYSFFWEYMECASPYFLQAYNTHLLISQAVFMANVTIERCKSVIRDRLLIIIVYFHRTNRIAFVIQDQKL